MTIEIKNQEEQVFRMVWSTNLPSSEFIKELIDLVEKYKNGKHK